MSVATKLLVIKPSSLGDIIHGLQVVESIRVQSPQLHVTWVAEAAFSPVVEACATVDDVLIFERKGGLSRFFRLLKQIRAGGFDLVIDLQGLARSGLMTCAAQAGRKLGRSDAREGAGLFYSEKVPLPQQEKAHAVEILAQFLPALGLRKEIVSSLGFDFPNASRAALPGIYGKCVLVFPESRRPEKEWPGFPEFIRRAARKYPECRFLWCASARSGALCTEAGNIVNLAGKTDLLQIIALIQEAEVVVANDSGPVHIAAAVGTPVLGLYGPTSPALYGPYPLDKPVHRTLNSENGRMDSISVDRVLAVLKDLI